MVSSARAGLSLLTLAILVAASPSWAGGWYLMRPPVDEQSAPVSSAPLHLWREYAAYDTAEACERGWSFAVEIAASDLARSILERAKCVAVDDPRLGASVEPPPTAASAGPGWYLLAAPGATEMLSGVTIYGDAPLSDWHNLGVFDLAADCEATRRRWVALQLEVMRRRHPADSPFEQDTRDYKNATIMAAIIECTASDDVRLAQSSPERHEPTGFEILRRFRALPR